MFGINPGFPHLNSIAWNSAHGQNPSSPDPSGPPARHQPTSPSLVPHSSPQAGGGSQAGGTNRHLLQPQAQDPAATVLYSKAFALKAPLLERLEEHGPLNLEVLSRQFEMQGLALRATLGKEGADNIASGAVLKHSAAGRVTDDMTEILSERSIHEMIKEAGGPDVPPVMPPHDLAASHPELGAAGSVEQEAHRATLLHSAYEQAIARLEATDPRNQEAIDNIKLSHMAFKFQVSDRENRLEHAEMAQQIAVERASNKVPVPGFRGEEKRKVDTAAASDQLKQAKSDLKAFHGASNFILAAEHLESVGERAINMKEDGVKKTLPKLAKVFVGQGLPQALASFGHWGYARNAAGLAVTNALQGNVTRLSELAATVAVQAAALGASHKLIGDTVREGLHSMTEIGDWVRPIEKVDAEVYFPDAPRAAFGANGQVKVLSENEHAEVNKASSELRQKYNDKVLNGGLGTVKGDVAGYAAFGTAHAIRDMLGHLSEYAKSIHGKADASFVGGGAMAFTQNLIALTDRHDGLPTRVFAKHANPRPAWLRMWTSAQKLDFTQQANRMDLYSRIWGSGIGMAVATSFGEAVDRLRGNSSGSGLASQLGYAFLEGLKSPLTLMPFFAVQTAEQEGKKLNPNGTSVVKNRLLAGPLNVASPFYRQPGAQATHAAPPRTFEHGAQDVNNVLRGAIVTPAHAGAALTEVAGQAAAAVVKGAVKGTVKGAVAVARLPGKAIEAASNGVDKLRNRRQAGPDEEQGGSNGQQQQP